VRGRAVAESGSERRRHPRASLEVPARLVIDAVGYAVPAQLRDLSHSGCFFATAAPIRVGWTVSLSFLVKPREACEATGQVVREQNAQGFGVAFQKVNQPLLALVDRLLATPAEQQGELLRALCDLQIDIGYLRRPEQRGAARRGRLVPPECPKCGCRVPVPEEPEGAAPEACTRCGLTFALWSPEQAREVIALDQQGEDLWVEVLADWSTVEKHDAFLKHCSPRGLLPLAGRRYRQRLDDDPANVMAARMQDRVIAMATASFIRPPPVVNRAVTRNLWFWAVVLLFAVGGFAAATTQFLGSRTHRPAPPPVPPAGIGTPIGGEVP
jgi:hypothetical protein